MITHSHHTTNIMFRTTAGALLCLVALAACGDKEAANGEGATVADPAMLVGPENVAVVASEMISSGPSVSGALAAEREATVRAEVAGPILSVHADEGSRVARGALLARIDDRTAQEGLLSARSGVNTAQSNLNLAQRELDRFTKLKEVGAIADREFESVSLAFEGAQTQLADAKARLALMQKQVDDAQVRSPISGIVSARQINAGDVASPGTAMFTVVDPSSMRLEGAVPAAQLSAVKVGAPVQFTVSGYPDRAFVGKISRISPEADASTGQVRIVVTIPNARGGLVGGLFADGRVQAERRTAPVIHTAAVDTKGLRPWVLRLKGGKAERVEVELGLQDEETEKYEVLAGISVGDTLLVGAAQGISAGTPVRISAANDASTTARK